MTESWAQLRTKIISDLTASGPFEFAIDTSAGYPVRIFRNAPASLRELLLASRKFGERPYLLYGNEGLSFEEHFQQVASLARHLREIGVKKGDRVAIGMRNYPEWSVGFWACQAIGAVAVALNAWWTAEELDFALADSVPAALLIDGERLERLRQQLSRMDQRAVIVARRGGAGEGGIDFSAATEVRDGVLPDADVGTEDLATIFYTSGTTGKSKGAMATHRNHISNIMAGLLMGAAGSKAAGMPPPGPDAPQPGTLHTLPFFHIGGLTGLYMNAVIGGRMATMYKWDPNEAVRLIETHRLSMVSGVPTTMRQLLESATSMGAKLESLRNITAGGGPVPPDLLQRINAQFDQRAGVGNGYGLTETTSALIVNNGPEALTHPDSVGRPVATVDIRIVGEDGADRPTGEVGELWARGSNVIPGYWHNPEATEESFGGGWFRTGDLGYVDDQGLYYVVDRKKDMILRGGENIYCAEVEAAIIEQPGVIDVAVLGLPHPVYGEEVAAIVQVAPENLRDEFAEQIRSTLELKIAKFKIPTSMRLTDSELTRTATGKMLKRELRKIFF